MRKNLDVWDKYSVYTDNVYQNTGFAVEKTSMLAVTDLTAAVTLGVGSTGLITSGASTIASAVAIPVQGRVSIGGQVFTCPAGLALSGNLVGLQLSPAPQAAIAVAVGNYTSAQLLVRQGQELNVKTYTPTLQSINVAAHGIDIYKQFPANFFNQYTTYHYGGPNINAPTDVGSLFIPFCLYPGTYQPSGHINISRAREFYLTYTASAFDSALGNNALVGILVVIASAINFLLINLIVRVICFIWLVSKINQYLEAKRINCVNILKDTNYQIITVM
jgi:hypothetical protein